MLQTNLRKIFIFYCNNDPAKKKILKKPKTAATSARNGIEELGGSENGELSPRSQNKKPRDQYYLSMEGVLKFLYNFSIIDRFVRRKALAIILDGFKDYVDFSDFMKLLRLISEEMYFDYPAINSTAKLKRLLEKLNLESPLEVKLMPD